jgi:hypothetical protein
MRNFNAIDGSRMVDSAVKQIPVEDRSNSRHFVFDPEEGTLLHIETENDSVNIATGGFLFRVDFSENGDYTITLVC